jgi:hypothetical protein
MEQQFDKRLSTQPDSSGFAGGLMMNQNGENRLKLQAAAPAAYGSNQKFSERMDLSKIRTRLF